MIPQSRSVLEQLTFRIFSRKKRFCRSRLHGKSRKIKNNLLSTVCHFKTDKRISKFRVNVSDTILFFFLVAFVYWALKLYVRTVFTRTKIYNYFKDVKYKSISFFFHSCKHTKTYILREIINTSL